MFPSPTDPTEPVTKDLASEWLLAERQAGSPKLRGGVWHPFRRKWVTARKHLSLTDLASAGGWRSKETLLRCYQQPYERTMLNVVLGGLELRQRRA